MIILKIFILSISYRVIRFLTTKILYLFQRIFSKPKNLEPAVKIGDIALYKFQVIGKFIYDFEIPNGNSIEIFDLKFPSPIIGSSFKSNSTILDIWMRMGLGGLIFKTIMKEKRTGNKQPRLQDAYSDGENGLYNSLGLPGVGINTFLKFLKNTNLWSYKRPLGISIGGDNEEEYLSNIKVINDYLLETKKMFFYELNISCPNTKNGQSICDNPSSLESLLKKIRINHSATLSVKISPDISNDRIMEIASICKSFSKVLINAGNTQFKKPSQVGVKPEYFSMKGGGLSGSPLFNRTLEMVNVLNDFNVPIIATGGISTLEHINILKRSGASLFGVASSLVLDPYCIPRIHSKL